MAYKISHNNKDTEKEMEENDSCFSSGLESCVFFFWFKVEPCP